MQICPSGFKFCHSWQFWCIGQYVLPVSSFKRSEGSFLHEIKKALPGGGSYSIKVPVFCPCVVELSGRLTGACIPPPVHRTQFLPWSMPGPCRSSLTGPPAQTWLVSGSSADLGYLLFCSWHISESLRLSGQLRIHRGQQCL